MSKRKSKSNSAAAPSTKKGFSMKRINGQSAKTVGIGLGLAFAGNLVGNALGGGANKLGALALAGIGIASGKQEYLTPAALGMFVSTPATSTKAAIANAGGVGNWLKTAPQAMKLQAGRHLQNVVGTASTSRMLSLSAEELRGLDSLEDYIAGLDFADTQEADMQGMNLLEAHLGELDYPSYATYNGVV